MAYMNIRFGKLRTSLVGRHVSDARRALRGQKASLNGVARIVDNVESRLAGSRRFATARFSAWLRARFGYPPADMGGKPREHVFVFRGYSASCAIQPDVGLSPAHLRISQEEKFMLKIHHLGHSQSERVVWLCEELSVPYELEKYTRDPVTRLSPQELKALHPLGAAPLIEVDGMLLAESAAIVEFILARYGRGLFQLGPDHPDFASYLYWLHFANGNLQPVMGRSMIVERCGLAPGHPVQTSVQERLDKVLALLEARLAQNDYLAGSEFTAADIMSVFSLTTMRLFRAVDLTPYPNILAYLQRIGARAAYQRAMVKGDPDLTPMLT
jgi:glutathione S-transferase